MITRLMCNSVTTIGGGGLVFFGETCLINSENHWYSKKKPLHTAKSKSS